MKNKLTEARKHIIEIDCDCFSNNKKMVEGLSSRLSLEIIDLKKHIKLVEENLLHTQIKLNAVKCETIESIKEIVNANKPLISQFRGWLIAKGFLKDFE